MLRFLLVAILLMLIARAFWRVVDGVVEAAGGRKPREHQRQTQALKLVRDPVCGTYVPPATALTSRAHGTTEYFCSERCRDEYQSHAEAQRQ